VANEMSGKEPERIEARPHALPTMADAEARMHPLVAARRKLGRSWHTRRLSPGTRRACLRGLTHVEWLWARAAGWIR
jgi:hypothetical protein